MITKPLTNLTRISMVNKVKWNEEYELAFNYLKEALIKAPVLITPNWKKKSVLQTDASAYGLGYALSQMDSQGEEHSIEFVSKKLLPNEWKYLAIEWEVLAMVKGVMHFRTYLEGTEFTIQTEHRPVTHLGNVKENHGRLARGALSLLPYQFKIRVSFKGWESVRATRRRPSTNPSNSAFPAWWGRAGCNGYESNL